MNGPHLRYLQALLTWHLTHHMHYHKHGHKRRMLRRYQPLMAQIARSDHKRATGTEQARNQPPQLASSPAIVSGDLGEGEGEGEVISFYVLVIACDLYSN